MTPGLAVGFISILCVAAGFVLTVLGLVLSWIDRHFDEPVEDRPGPKLRRLGLALMVGSGLVLTLRLWLG